MEPQGPGLFPDSQWVMQVEERSEIWIHSRWKREVPGTGVVTKGQAQPPVLLPNHCLPPENKIKKKSQLRSRASACEIQMRNERTGNDHLSRAMDSFLRLPLWDRVPRDGQASSAHWWTVQPQQPVQSQAAFSLCSPRPLFSQSTPVLSKWMPERLVGPPVALQGCDNLSRSCKATLLSAQGERGKAEAPVCVAVSAAVWKSALKVPRVTFCGRPPDAPQRRLLCVVASMGGVI